METLAHNPFMRIAHKSLVYLLVFCIVNMPVWALSGFNPVNGTANFDGTNLTVDQLRTVIEWNDFDTAPGQLLQFLANGVGDLTLNHAVLNKVIGLDPTLFEGILQGGQGHIILFNPNGITIGSTASINAGRFTASTMDLQNIDDFLNEGILVENLQLEFAKTGGDPAAMINVLTPDGPDKGINAQRVELLAQRITNAGVIETGTDGIVVMAAGDRVLLGETGSNIIVEMDSATGVVADIETDFGTITGGPAGSVTNDGTITSPGGEVVLAAGDIFAIAVVNDDRAVKVHFGTGTVNQNGEINVNADTGDGGTVSLTAGDATTLGASSETYANAGTDGDSGLVSVHSKGDTEIVSGARIEAKGGYFKTPLETDPEYVDGLPDEEQDIAVVRIIQQNSVEIIGDTIKFDTSLDTIDATASDALKKGKIYFEADSLTIADVLPGDYENTVLAEYIENQSYAGVDIELATNGGDGMITVGPISSNGALSDGYITGWSGDITLRNLFIGGGIDLTPRDVDGVVIPGSDPINIETISDKDYAKDAGNIFMVAGTGGITAGNLLSYIIGGENLPYEPGRIRLLTATNEYGDTGDISVKTMYVAGGGVTEISAIASGNLTVDGAVNLITHETSEEDKTIGFARICLISEDGTVLVDTGVIDVGEATGRLNPSDNISISSKGKFKSIGTIKIAAEEDVIVRNADSDNAIYIKTFNSTAPNSEKDPANLPYTADSCATIDAGGQIIFDQGEGVDEVIYGQAADSDIPILITANLSSGGNGVTIDGASPDYDEFEQYNKDGVLISRETVTLKINQDGDCVDCPRPPGLILQIAAVDDEAIQHMNLLIDELSNGNISVLDNDLGNPNLTIIKYTDPVLTGTDLELGTLVFDKDTGEFVYTPEEGFAGDTVEFEYFIIAFDTETGTYLTDSATVTIEYTNELPDGDAWLGQTHMDDTLTDTLQAGSLEDNADVLGQTDTILEVIADGVDTDQNFSFNGDLDYNSGTDEWTYDPSLEGYVGDDVDDWVNDGGYTQTTSDPENYATSSADEIFEVKLWDGQYDYIKVADGEPAPSEEYAVYDVGDGYTVYRAKEYGTGSVSVDITNDLPEGDSWLGTTQMDTALTGASLETDGFTDINGDDILDIEIDGVSSDDYNGSFGGSLTYDGTDYDYDPTAMGLPGYAGDDVDDFDDGGYVIGDNADDRFDVKLWDGEYLYTFDDQGGFERTEQYGDGTISVDITNELPEADAWFGQVHMDSQGVTQDLEVDFAPSITVDTDTYTGSVIGSDNYGGTLEFDGDTWTYSTDPTLPGYIGDDNDDFDQGGYVADDLFSVNLSNGQFDYWFGEEPAPDGYEYYEPGDIYRKAVFSEGTGTVSVDITNELPTIDENTTIEHMDETITDQLFAADQLDSNPIVGLDDLTMLDGGGNPTNIYTSDFGVSVTLTDNGDGTYSYTYDPVDGYVDEDSFDVTVWDGQRDYVFVDGEIVSDDPVTVNGTVSLEYTNILPGANGDLGTTESGTPITVGQSGVTSPVLVIDIPDLPQQDIDDVLSIPNGTYTGSAGGTLVFDGTNWTYTPAPGFSGTETFTIDVWDGQNAYGNHIEEGIQGPVFGQGTVTVTVGPPPPTPTPTPTPVPEPLAPIAPLADYEVPKLVGCPAEMEAAANELAVNSDELQLLIANAMATNPNLQPCDACQNLLEAASALQSINEEQLNALVLVFNTAAPIDQAFSPEMSASLATAFANFRELETQLATVSPEDYEQYQQYTMVDELVEAFVSYVAVLDNDLRLPVGDSMALVMERYFEPIEASGNPNIGAYLIEKMRAVQTVTE